MATFKIEKLNIYPLKSAQGTNVDEIFIDASGLEGDRICAVMDKDNKVITARERPELFSIRASYNKFEIIFTAEGIEALHINLENCPKTRVEAQLFREPFQAYKITDDSSKWFSEVLGQECHLILSDAEQSRTIRHVEGTTPIALKDACPIHLVNQHSVEDLEKRLKRPTESARFRPNLLISGVAPYEEENWKEVQIGDMHFKVVLKTKRCTMITIDPETHQKDPDSEPLRELATYKREGGKISFGIYLVPQGQGKIRLDAEGSAHL